MAPRTLAGVIGLLLGLLACAAPGPRPLVAGEDACAHCHMTMVEPGLAGELVFRTGRILVYDDLGCLADGVRAQDPSALHSIWAADFLQPDSLAPVERMVFYRTDRIRTPMAHGVVAVRPGPAADSLGRALGAEAGTWADVLAWTASGPRR